jgi:hypothetical protein
MSSSLLLYAEERRQKRVLQEKSLNFAKPSAIDHCGVDGAVAEIDQIRGNTRARS